MLVIRLEECRKRFYCLKIYLLYVFTAGLDEGGRPDDPQPAHSRRHTQLAHQRQPRQLSHVAATYQTGQGDRPGLLHVSDKHQCHEETARLYRRTR